MSYKRRKETIEKQNHLKEIPEEELEKMREILNEYIAKNRKKVVMCEECLLKYRINNLEAARYK